MPQLITDFFAVAKSGQTVDGRTIKPQWLIDMAQSYSMKTYVAKIWPDHLRWSALGEIAEVRAVDENGTPVSQSTGSTGTVTLENRIIPYNDLIQIVRRGSLTQPSIEVIENFAGSGKAYQFGMGATDTPASLGTERFPIMFSTSKGSNYERYRQQIAMDAGVPVEKVHIFSCPVQWDDLELKKQGTKFFDMGGLFRKEEPHHGGNADDVWDWGNGQQEWKHPIAAKLTSQITNHRHNGGNTDDFWDWGNG